jgi:replicative DNA helicase
MNGKPLRSIANNESAHWGDRLPPQNLDAEKSLLGGLMMGGRDAYMAAEHVRAEDFYRERNAKIFEAIAALHAKSEPIDHLTVTNMLQVQGTYEAVGGAGYLSEVLDAPPAISNVAYYAKIVVEKSTLRNLIAASTGLAGRAFEGAEPTEQILRDAEKQMLAIARGGVQKQLDPIGEIVFQAVKRLQDIYNQNGAYTGIETGFDYFDKMTSGLQGGQLIVLAARPGMGKTSLVLNMAAHAALHGDKAVAFFSLEMSKEELVSRMLCAEARINMADIRTGNMPLQSWERLTNAATHLTNAPIYIDDHGVMDIGYIVGKCRRQAMDGRLDMVIIDYLQLMSGNAKSERREQEIAEISRGLKGLAKELNIPVIALSQLNRMVEQRPDKRPHMADLRESGAIEQDADIIGFIFRPQVYAKDEEERRAMQDKPAELIIAKHRAGPTDTVLLTFNAAITRFENWAKPADNYPSE